MNLLIPVNNKIRMLKKKTNPFEIPEIFVSFSKTNVMIVTEIANTAKNPVLIPKIRKIIDAASPVLVAWERDEKSIFSGDAKRGTLKRAFARNKINNEIETFLTLFCSLGNLTRIALPKIIPCSNPIAKAPKTAIREKIGSWNKSTRDETKAMTSKINVKKTILVRRWQIVAKLPKSFHLKFISHDFGVTNYE